MNGRPWSTPQIVQLRALYPSLSTKSMERRLGHSQASIYGMAKKLGLKKSPEYLARHCRLQKGSDIGSAFRFRKGQRPANKGLRRPGWHAGRMKETQFKKGELNGKAKLNVKPVGTILADHDGYLRIKIRERQRGDAAGWNPEIWPCLHHKVWREHKGPIPPKHVVAFKDRNRQNCAIENLELISMAENARRNQMWTTMPRELAEAIQLNGVLKRKIRRLNGEKQDKRST